LLREWAHPAFRCPNSAESTANRGNLNCAQRDDERAAPPLDSTAFGPLSVVARHALQAGGRRFDPVTAHQQDPAITRGNEQQTVGTVPLPRTGSSATGTRPPYRPAQRPPEPRAQALPDDELTDADVRLSLLGAIRRKPTPENVAALERWDRMHAAHSTQADPTVPIEDWSDEELERYRARLVVMAKRLDDRIESRAREDRGAPPRSRSPALVEVSGTPLAPLPTEGTPSFRVAPSEISAVPCISPRLTQISRL